MDQEQSNKLRAHIAMKHNEYQIFKKSYAKEEDLEHVKIFDSFISPLALELQREWSDEKGKIFMEYLEKAFKFFNIEQRLFGDH